MSLNIKAEPSYPNWWVPRDSHTGQTISWTTNLFACTFMLVAAQYTSAVWAVSAIKARKMMKPPTTQDLDNHRDHAMKATATTNPKFSLPEKRSQRFGLGAVLGGLYAIQVWMCWPSEICPLDGSLSDQGQVVTSCYPAIDMLKSIIFVAGGPVVCFIYCWLVWSPSINPGENEMGGGDAFESQTTHKYSSELQLKASHSTAGSSDTDSSSSRSCEDHNATPRSPIPSTDLESQYSSQLINTDEDQVQQNKKEKLEEKLKKMLPYINNLKVFMTWYVITAHTAQVLLGMAFTIETPIETLADKISWGSLAFVIKFADCFLMSTFFFLSGYFSPRAMKKRGVGEFLFERAKRLAIPFSVFAYLLFPYVLVPLFMMPFLGPKYVAPVNVTGGDDTSLYLRVPSVMWFLFLLLAFNTIYALGFGPNWHVEMPCPSLPKLFTMVTICLGIINSCLGIAFSPMVNVFTVPQFSLRIVTYATFFYGGCVAGTNKWLDVVQERLQDPRMGKRIRCGVYSTVFVSYMAYMTVFSLFYFPQAYQIWPLIICYVLDGLIAISACLGSVIFFKDYFNWVWNPATFIIWSGTYAAYILQTHFILLGVYIVLAIDPANNPSAAMTSTYELNAAMSWPYTILASTVAVSCSFVFGVLMRNIPNFDKIF